MKNNYLYINQQMEAAFGIADANASLHPYFYDNYLRFVWNNSPNPIPILVDHQPDVLQGFEIICLNHYHHLEWAEGNEGIVQLVFNKTFYCIHTNDKEVSCKGLLFFAAKSYPKLILNDFDVQRFQLLLDIMKEEFMIDALHKEEMLRILLKRFIIRATRIGQQQLLNNGISAPEYDLIRDFNSLVDEKFKRLHKVADYADLLNRASKTLSNVFKKQTGLSPLQVIHERQVLEAKRLLLYSNLSIKEIQLELGFEDGAQISKLFKRLTGHSCQEFRIRREKSTTDRE